MEAFFLTIANIFPHSKLWDKYRWFFLKLAGVKINSSCTVWGNITIRPWGGAKRIQIGDNVFVNTGVRFGVAEKKVIIRDNVLVGPESCSKPLTTL